MLNYKPIIPSEKLIVEMIKNDKNIALKDSVLEKEFPKIKKVIF